MVVDELDVVEEAVEPNRTGQRPLTKASKIVRPSGMKESNFVSKSLNRKVGIQKYIKNKF